MSDWAACEDDMDRFFARDHFLPHITAQAVGGALAGFALRLSGGRDMEWLATAVRRSLAISMPNISDGPMRTSNADVRGELERLAALAGATWLELFKCDHAADSRLWDHAWRHWDGEGGVKFGDSLVMGEASDYHRFKAAVAELDWLASFMMQAARETESQRGPWRKSEEKQLRIERGQYLALIFEAGFGEAVTANNHIKGGGDARHKAPTPFMDFYERMVTLAFGAQETTNLAEVVKAACQLHRQNPAQFGEGVIPGL